jgi:predicted DNA binding CopG/RHH family protein
MKKEYDLSKFRSRKNPYTPFLKKQITIRINNQAIEYFKSMSESTGIPYQNLIDSYLTDCASTKRKLTTTWSD